MNPFAVHPASGRRPLVLSCEHASCAVPPEYGDLGLPATELREHIGWDIGAADLTIDLARRLDAPAVLSGVSRLLVDCNRDLGDHDLIAAESHGVSVPGNRHVDETERHRRIGEFYEPFHVAVDEVMRQHPRSFLLSVHSFTPSLNGAQRRFDVGVLFDEFAADARRVGDALARNGLAVRYNEPYSGLDGLIYSARTHGQRHAARYLEIEINNRLLRDAPGVQRIAAAVHSALRDWWEGTCV
ncbi:MAG: N-formylglutamate amidohydrolase [Deltaproteobacteria bacterium]|nr:N-formylglutamate amidohydrolase [Deltaproteobacteria bacterium]